MEHAKKMIIVSPDVLQRIQNAQPSSSPSSPVSKVAGDTVSELDREMSRLLNNKDLGDKDKWEQYQQVLQRYLHFATQNRKPIQLPIVEMDVNDGSINMLGNEQIVETFTKNYKKDASNFLKALNGKTDLIRWDDEGVVYIHNEKIPHSNIIDLLHDVIRLRKSIQPPGWEQLMQILKEINIPIEFVTNPFGREYLMRLKGDIRDRSNSSVRGVPQTSARRYLDFHTPKNLKATTASSNKTAAGRSEDVHPSIINTVKTIDSANSQFKRINSSETTPKWEKFKL